MKIAFIHTGKAFLPEIPAYRSYLEQKNQTTIELERYEDIIDHGDLDLVFRFGGLLKTARWQTVPEIHEYHSASTTSAPVLRNIIKSFAGSRPQGRIFLNNFVRSQFFFRDKIPYIYRDMGASDSLLQCNNGTTKDFDIVYAGSISGRPGLLKVLIRLADMGFILGVAGNASHEEIEVMKKSHGIIYLGLLPASQVIDLISRSRYGLNYCPDIYPINKQTSTKVIEYLVAGIPIISNKYCWIESHKNLYGYDYIKLSDLISVDSFSDKNYHVLSHEDRSRFTWNRVLLDCNFLEFLQSRIISHDAI